MAIAPRVVSLAERRPKAPVPVVILLTITEGLPRKLGCGEAGGFAYLSPVTTGEIEEEDCPQCVLLEKTLAALENALTQASAPPPGIYLEASAELDPRKLVEALRELPKVRVQAVLAVMEARAFLADFVSEEIWEERLAGSEQTASAAFLSEPVIETWIQQLELCHAHVLFGIESLAEGEQQTIRTFLSALNPGAAQLGEDQSDLWQHLAPGARADLPMNLERFPAWKQTLEARESSPHYFRSKRPFHPVRFRDFVHDWPEYILRTVGTVWVASHNDLALEVNQIGPAAFTFSPEGMWIGTLSPAEKNYALRQQPDLLRDWDDKYGDRLTELAFVAAEAIPEAWQRKLAACVLSDVEMRMDWSKFPNPFPTFLEEEPPEPRTHLRLV